MKLLKEWLNPKLNSEISPTPSNCSWKPVIDLLEGPCQRSQHAVCKSADFLYLYGGRGPYGCLNDLWKYNIEKQSWSLVDITNSDDKPSSLEGHSLVICDENLYLFGGETSFASAHEVPLWKFSFKLLQWKKLTSDHPTPVGRREHVAVMHEGKMVIHGGYIDLKGPTDELWCYNVSKNSWKMLKSLNNVYPAARYKHSGAVYQDLLWICGGLMGVTDRNETQVWTWNLQSMFWTPIKIRGAPSQLFNHASSVAGSEVYIFGGNQDKGQVCSKLWRAKMSELITKHSQTWRVCQLDDKVNPSPSSSHCMVVLPVTKSLSFKNPRILNVMSRTWNEKPCTKLSYQPITNGNTPSANSTPDQPLPKEATANDAYPQSVFDVTNNGHTYSREKCGDYKDTDFLLEDEHDDDIFDFDRNTETASSTDCSITDLTNDNRIDFKDTELLLKDEIIEYSSDLSGSDSNAGNIFSNDVGGGGDMDVNSKENVLQSLNLNDCDHFSSNNPKRLPYKYNGWINKSYTISPRKFDSQEVTRFSYNLSRPKQPFQPARQKKERKVYQTTSFIDLSADTSTTVQHSDEIKSMKKENRDSPVKFSKTQSNEQIALPITFYENSKKLLEYENTFGECVQRNATSEERQATLLLLGGSARAHNFHMKEPIHMWRCNIRLNLSAS